MGIAAKEFEGVNMVHQKILRRWSAVPQSGDFVWIRYAGNVTYGQLVHCMPELNMFTVRPDDGGLTRLVTRGIEDILPFTYEHSPLSPPGDDEWDVDLHSCAATLIVSSSAGELAPCYSGCVDAPTSLRSPLFIDAGDELSLHRISADDGTSGGPPPSFSGFLSTSPFSFTLSPTTGQSDSGEAGYQQASDELTHRAYNQTGTLHYPVTPHSTSVSSPSGLPHGFWDSEETDELPCTTTTSFPVNAADCSDECQTSTSLETCSSSDGACTDSLSAASAVVASAIEVIRQWIDSFSTCQQQPTTTPTQEAILHGLNEAIAALLLPSNSEHHANDVSQVSSAAKYSQSFTNHPPSPTLVAPVQKVDALTAALLSPTSSHEPDVVYKRSRLKTDLCSTFINSTSNWPPMASFDSCSDNGVTSSNQSMFIENRPTALPSQLVNRRSTSASLPIRASSPIAMPAAGSGTLRSILGTVPDPSNSEENLVSCLLDPESVAPNFPCAPHNSFPSLQVPFALRELSQLCSGHHDPLCVGLTELLQRLGSILLSLAELPVHSQTTRMTDDNKSASTHTPKLLSVGTQSDRCDSPSSVQSQTVSMQLSKIVLCATDSGLLPSCSTIDSIANQSSRGHSFSAPSEQIIQLTTELQTPVCSATARDAQSFTNRSSPVVVRDVHSRSYADQSHRHPSVPRKQRTISDTVTGNTVVYGSSVSTTNSTSYGGRSEIRKCRRIYGIEHRDQWCNQVSVEKGLSSFSGYLSGKCYPI
ncbi:hypothetical protein AHF37_03218 [Paragonimus kellicotti]|nr:hypothetical protein AHF37_03218 [Paragonimus kellicotti]